MKYAVIPARGGSKRIPRKNIREFHGLPIIAWSIKAALSSSCFNDVIVSTDDPEIADIARHYGASVPFVRPSRLADDFADTYSVISHAVSWLRENGHAISSACCIYPTAPLLDSSILRNSESVFDKGCDYCVSVCRFPFPIQRSFFISDGMINKFMDEDSLQKRSQDLKPGYYDAGQFYWGTTNAWLNEPKILSYNARVFELPYERVQDIDDMNDWHLAELKFQLLNTTSQKIIRN